VSVGPTLSETISNESQASAARSRPACTSSSTAASATNAPTVRAPSPAQATTLTSQDDGIVGSGQLTTLAVGCGVLGNPVERWILERAAAAGTCDSGGEWRNDEYTPPAVVVPAPLPTKVPEPTFLSTSEEPVASEWPVATKPVRFVLRGGGRWLMRGVDGVVDVVRAHDDDGGRDARAGPFLPLSGDQSRVLTSSRRRRRKRARRQVLRRRGARTRRRRRRRRLARVGGGWRPEWECSARLRGLWRSLLGYSMIIIGHDAGLDK
jgi:hypothetical protein